MTTTDLLILELAKVVPTADVDPCGCIFTGGHFYPCPTCKAEVAAELAIVYGSGAAETDWLTTTEAL